MPIFDNPNTVTVGSVCLGCGLYATKTCPYGNHNKPSTLQFTGEPGTNKCHVYSPLIEAENNSFIKTGGNMENKIVKKAQKLTDSELNVEIYNKIASLNNDEEDILLKSWNHIFPKELSGTKKIASDGKEKIKKEKKKLFEYWSYLFPENFAKDMVTDSNETVQRGIKKKK